MALKVWGFSIGADNRPAEKAFGEIPVFANKAGKKAGKDLAGGMKAGLGPIGQIIAASMGEGPIERINKAMSGIGSLSTGASAATIAFGGMGLAAGLAGAGVVSLVHHAASLAKTLEPFTDKGLLPMESIDGVKAADAAMVSIVRVGEAATVMMASELSPAVERVSVDLVALGLYGIEALNGLQTSARDAAIWVGSHLVQSLTGPVYLLRQIASGALLVTEALGGNVPQLESAIKAYDDWSDRIATTAVDYYAKSLTNAEEAGSDYIARAREIVGVQANLTAKTKATIAATQDLTSAWKTSSSILAAQADLAEAAGSVILAQLDEWAASAVELAKISGDAATALLTPQQKITAELDAQIARTRELAVLSGDYATAAQAEFDLRAAASTRLADLEIQDRERVRAATEQITGQILSGVESLAAARIQAEGSAASGAVAIQKTVAIVQIGIAAKQAFAQALTIGPILGPIAAGLVAGLALTQAAQVAATPVPSFATGRMPLQYQGERAAYIGDGETVLNNRGSAILGEDAARDLNQGRVPNQITTLSVDGARNTMTTTSRLSTSPRRAEELKRITDSGQLGTTGRATWR